MSLQKINGQKSVFETIKQINKNGQEFWYARDFQNILGYVKWDKFLSVLDKAKEACVNSKQNIQDHFLHMEKMVDIESKISGT